MVEESSPRINGWLLLAHPLILDEIERLIKEVQSLKLKQPEAFQSKRQTKLLAAIIELVFIKIPADPENSIYRQGLTLGKENKHWYRAKFYQQYRLFFRFNKKKKIIIYAWVNDENTKRARGDKTDAYAVFEKMLRSNNPPNSWDELLEASLPATSHLSDIVSFTSEGNSP